MGTGLPSRLPALSERMIDLPLPTLLIAAIILFVLGLIVSTIALLYVARGRVERAERRIAEAAEVSRRELAASEARYLSLFENAPLPMLEEDFSPAKRRIERALREGEALHRFLAPQSAGLRECAALIRVLAVNLEARRYFGVERDADDRVGLPSFFGPESWAPFSEELVALFVGQSRFEGHFPIVAAGGEPRDVIVKVSVAPGAGQSLDRVHVSFIDITPLKATEDALRRSLAENQALLRELNHRTRNNLQVVCSMLNMESSRLGDERAKIALQETEERIQAIAMIHERLSASGDLSCVEMQEYVMSLTELLVRSRGADTGRLALQFEVEDIRLALDQAVPCGIALNELVTNALKHAFPGGKKGTIRICFRAYEDNEVELIVEDDGVGVPTNWNSRAASSLGLQNVYLMGEGQLRGSVSVDADRGLRWRILFPLIC